MLSLKKCESTDFKEVRMNLKIFWSSEMNNWSYLESNLFRKLIKIALFSMIFSPVANFGNHPLDNLKSWVTVISNIFWAPISYPLLQFIQFALKCHKEPFHCELNEVFISRSFKGMIPFSDLPAYRHFFWWTKKEKAVKFQSQFVTFERSLIFFKPSRKDIFHCTRV